MSKFQEMRMPNSIKQYLFFCPGYEESHFVRVKGEGPNWKVTGLENDKPTVSPSIRVRGGKNMKEVCHSFVKDGKIQYLNDCTHKLKGQTVEIPDFEEV